MTSFYFLYKFEQFISASVQKEVFFIFKIAYLIALDRAAAVKQRTSQGHFYLRKKSRNYIESDSLVRHLLSTLMSRRKKSYLQTNFCEEIEEKHPFIERQ